MPASDQLRYFRLCQSIADVAYFPGIEGLHSTSRYHGGDLTSDRVGDITLVTNGSGGTEAGLFDPPGWT
jgi:hypothetical protein